jgi:hypothetical protein
MVTYVTMRCTAPARCMPDLCISVASSCDDVGMNVRSSSVRTNAGMIAVARCRDAASTSLSSSSAQAPGSPMSHADLAGTVAKRRERERERERAQAASEEVSSWFPKRTRLQSIDNARQIQVNIQETDSETAVSNVRNDERQNASADKGWLCRVTNSGRRHRTRWSAVPTTGGSGGNSFPNSKT